MTIIPLYEVKNGIHYPRFKKGSYVYAVDTEFGLIKGNRYLVTASVGMDIEIINEVCEKEIFSHENFSMTKPN